MKRLFRKLDQAFNYQRMKHLLITALLGCVVWLSFELASTMRAIRQQAYSSKAYQERLEGVLDSAQAATEKLPKLVDELSQTLIEGRVQLGRNGEALTKQIDGLGLISNQVEGLVGDLRGEIKDQSQALLVSQSEVQSLVTKLDPELTRGITALAGASELLQHSFNELDLILSNPNIQKFIDFSLDHGETIILEVEKSTGNLTLISSNGAQITESGSNVSKDVEKWIHGYLTTEPKWYQKYILTPLKASLGFGLSAYQVFRK